LQVTVSAESSMDANAGKISLLRENETLLKANKSLNCSLCLDQP